MADAPDRRDELIVALIRLSVRKPTSGCTCSACRVFRKYALEIARARKAVKG